MEEPPDRIMTQKTWGKASLKVAATNEFVVHQASSGAGVRRFVFRRERDRFVASRLKRV